MAILLTQAKQSSKSLTFDGHMQKAAMTFEDLCGAIIFSFISMAHYNHLTYIPAIRCTKHKPMLNDVLSRELSMELETWVWASTRTIAQAMVRRCCCLIIVGQKAIRHFMPGIQDRYQEC